MTSAHVAEVGDHDFEARVLGESRKRPVVVDFWAPWCGPCRALGPVLERLADEAAGAWLLAKVNTDSDPAFAQRYQVRGIPAVKAFRGGELVSEFTGALPEEMVRKWLEKVVPSAGQADAERAASLFVAGDLDGAEALAGSLLEEEPRLALAVLVRAQVALARGDADGASAWLDRLMDPGEHALEVERARAKVVLVRAAKEDGEVGQAARDALAGELEVGFSRLLGLVGRAATKKAAHEAALAVMGLAEPEVQREMRRRLSMALF